jgi:membrane-bound lytic murein transglycosylase MltF
MGRLGRVAHRVATALGLASSVHGGSSRAGQPQPSAAQAAGTLQAPSTRYDDYFRKYSKRYFGPGFAWRVFKAQAMAESGLDSTARSSAGARGVMQLMPATFALISAHRSEFKSPEDAQSNIAAGIAHDADMWHLFGRIILHPEHYRFMMAAYNAGEGTIQRAQMVARAAHVDETSWFGVASVAQQVPRWRYHETLGYVSRIAIYYRRLKMLDAVPPVEMDLDQP